MRYGFVVSKPAVSKPATQRPKLPGVGRLGLVEPTASADLSRLGWNTDAHVELLWSLSRAPDADAALRTMVRLADALGSDWPELNALLLTAKSLRGRLFGVLGSSLALGDHLVAHPQSWHLLHDLPAQKVELPSAAELRRAFTDCVAQTPLPEVQLALRRLYRDRLTGAGRARRGAHRRERARAAVRDRRRPSVRYGRRGAGRRRWTSRWPPVCKDDTLPPRLAVIAMGKCGARELNYVSDVDVIFVGEEADAIARGWPAR